MSTTPFLTDVKTLRQRARRHIQKGALTEGYRADRDTVVRLLNEALATEIICVLRYKRHFFMASGIHAEGVAAEFLQHANEEQQHADQIAARIVQLGEDPDLNPATLLSRSHAEYDESTSLRQMLEADLVAERIAIESYREMINFIGQRDPTSRRLLVTQMARELVHAPDRVSVAKRAALKAARTPTDVYHRVRSRPR